MKAIAFHLPQFHPIPENNEWWGEGFTEWTNVTKARPQYRGHHQPHLPADLGYYDLRLPESRAAQAALAAAYGIHGFCYYHYWFNGRRILNRPVDEILQSGEPDFPFCLCWANENWTRAWDGGESEILLQQNYSDSDDLDHIRLLCRFFADDRYVRVNGKPLFLVYRASLLPSPKRTSELWRDEARRHGVGEIYLCCVQSFATEHFKPAAIGFDAAVQFAPDWRLLGPRLRRRGFKGYGRLFPRRYGPNDHKIFSYAQLMNNMLALHDPQFSWFPCITPMWDNTARRSFGATILEGSTPELYGSWLSSVANKVKSNSTAPPLLFINAWNEWAEGNHLEPCTRWGRSYLEATKRALQDARR